MVNGNILLDEKGLDIKNVVDGKKRAAVGNFCEMVDAARKEADTLHYVYNDPCNLYSIKFAPDDSLCKQIGQRLFQELQTTFGNFPNSVIDIDEFLQKSEPRTNGGFEYNGHPTSDYIYSKATIDAWHQSWHIAHPKPVDWSESQNNYLPFYDETIDILREELKKLKENPDMIRGLEYGDKEYLKTTDLKSLNAKDVVVKFYSLIMNHKDESGEKISYAKEIGSKICELNCYHHEKELEDLNKENTSIIKIYSIKKDGKYQFLSIDKKHGRFELCNDKGNHVCELMFDGEPVENSQEPNHAILHIDEWKRIYNK